MEKEKINRYIQKAFLLVAVISSIQLLHVPCSGFPVLSA